MNPSVRRAACEQCHAQKLRCTKPEELYGVRSMRASESAMHLGSSIKSVLDSQEHTPTVLSIRRVWEVMCFKTSSLLVATRILGSLQGN